MKGLSYQNLYTMRDLFISYKDKDNEKLQILSAQISWSHNVAILSKYDDLLKKEFYMRMSKKNFWTYRVLLNQIDNKSYEKTLLSQTNFDSNPPAKMCPEAELTVKDEYALDFLEQGFIIRTLCLGEPINSLHQ